MDQETKLLVVGVSGRMGSEVVEAAGRLSTSGERLRVIGGIVQEGSSLVGSTLDGVSYPLTTNWDERYQEANVIVDFSSPDGAEKALGIALQRKLPLMLGSTGVSDPVEQRIREAGQKIAIVRATNTSVGVNVMLKLVRDASVMLGKEFEIEVVETHHHHKKDSPSGTAKSLLNQICASRDENVHDAVVFGRSGDKLSRRPDEIGVHSLRGGDVVGEHSVFYLGSGETFEITHRATRRSIFADGAIRAAKWLVGRAPGYYSMIDVLS